MRFYNLPHSFVFAGDEEHQALLAQSLINNFHIIWAGVNAAHLGFYLGPYWAYFTAFWLWLSKGDPLITGYISSLIGVATAGLLVLTGSAMFNRKTGLIAGVLYASLPLIVFLDQKYWNPTAVPFLSLLLFLSLYKAKKNPAWLIVFGAAYGALFHTHLSLMPLIIPAVIWIFREKIRPNKKIIFLSVMAFLVMIAPLIAFDYFRKGSNISTPLRYKEITSDYRNKIHPLQHANAMFQLLGRIWYIKAPSNNSDEVITSCTNASRIGNPDTDGISQRYNPPLFLSLTGTGVLLLFLFSKKTWQNKTNRLLALFILSIAIPFLFFPGGSFEYYLLGIFPLLMFLPAILMDYFPKINAVIMLAVISAVILGITAVITNKPDFGLSNKQSLIKQVSDVIKDEPFELKQTGLCHFYEGWRYLFVLNGKAPERSDSDQGLGWHYPNEITNNPVRFTIIMHESRVPLTFDPEDAVIIRSGGFSAFVFENKSDISD